LSETFEVLGHSVAHLTLVAPAPEEGVFQAGVDLTTDMTSDFSTPMTQRVAASISIVPDYRLTPKTLTLKTGPSSADNEVRIEFGKHLEVTNLTGIVCPDLCGIVSLEFAELPTPRPIHEHETQEGRAYVVRAHVDHSRLPSAGQDNLWVQFDVKSALPAGPSVPSITVPVRVIDNLRLQAPRRVDFGRIVVDSSTTRSIIIASPNSSPLSIADIQLESSMSRPCRIRWNADPRANGRFARVELTLTCSQAGPLSETLTVTSLSGHTSAAIQIHAQVAHGSASNRESLMIPGQTLSTVLEPP